MTMRVTKKFVENKNRKLTAYFFVMAVFSDIIKR
jgi:hypothetical protein